MATLRFSVAITVFAVAFLSWLILSSVTLAQLDNLVMPRTEEGRPDLQGVWLSNAAIPMERPEALADRPHLTDEEVAVLQTRANRIFRNGRSAYATPASAFRAALDDVETYEAWSTSSSIGMVDVSVTGQTSLVVDPPDGKIPARTVAAQSREAAVADGWKFKTGPEDFSSIHRCITTGVPRLGGNFGAGPYTYYQIVQTSEYFVLLSEAFHDARIVPLDGRPHISGRVRQWNGDSRGYWDGDALVVETKNFSPQTQHRFPSSLDTVAVERYRRLDNNTIEHTFTIRDEDVYTQSWTGMRHMPRMPEYIIYEYACHEGNYAVPNMLAGSRADERVASEGR